MKKTSSIIVILGYIFVLLSCQGKTGDPGPTGLTGDAGAMGAAGPAGPDPGTAFVDGSFSGTITGTKADGITPINETFSYTYDPGTESLSPPAGGIQSVILQRLQTLLAPQYLLELPLIINSSGPYIDSLTFTAYFSYFKALSGNKQFKLYATPILTRTVVVFPVDPANTDYQFDFTFSFYHSMANVDININTDNLVTFNTKAGEQVFFSGMSGGTFVKIIDAMGVESSNSSTYGNLVLNQGITPTYGYFYFTLNGTDLSKTVILPADTYTITGYSYDTATGNMAFDYTINMGGYPKPNSTRNPLTLIGSFAGKVRQTVNGTVRLDDAHQTH